MHIKKCLLRNRERILSVLDKLSRQIDLLDGMRKKTDSAFSRSPDGFTGVLLPHRSSLFARNGIQGVFGLGLTIGKRVAIVYIRFIMMDL
jgi:hypothetical protein